jgi:hypothetical protein
MLLIGKTQENGVFCLNYRGKAIAVIDEKYADMLIKMERQNQEMSMLLRISASGKDIKQKAASYVAENGLHNPLR